MLMRLGWRSSEDTYPALGPVLIRLRYISQSAVIDSAEARTADAPPQALADGLAAFEKTHGFMATDPDVSFVDYGGQLLLAATITELLHRRGRHLKSNEGLVDLAWMLTR